MSEQMTLPGFGSAISSPASADGPTPCASPDGPTIGRCGQDRHLASRGASPAREKAAATPGTSPPLFSAWSGLPAPQCCLASKSPARLSSDALQGRLDAALRDSLNGRGSMLYSMTLKPQVTPAGRRIFRLRASAPRISDSGCFSERSGWNTPRATDGTNGGPNQAGGALPADAAMAGWPTPNAGPQNDTDTRWEERRIACNDRHRNNGFGLTLGMMAQTCGPARLTVRGELLTGSTAGMASGGRLNPALSRWLMGYPTAWDDCADTVIPSFRRRLGRS